jgi:hypothetical protein
MLFNIQEVCENTRDDRITTECLAIVPKACIAS